MALNVKRFERVINMSKNAICIGLKKILFAVILAISLVFPSQLSYEHSPQFAVRTPEDILKFCEFFYEEYLLLGSDKLVEQHEQFPNLRACEILYNHIAWKSTHPLRNKVLIAEIEKYLGDSKVVKERHLREFNTIPNWIKSDAKKWTYKEITDTKFAYDIRSIIENNLIKIEPVKSIDCSGDCFSKDDFLEYSITNNFGESKNIRFTVTESSQNNTILTQREVTKENISSKTLSISNTLQFDEADNDLKCCSTLILKYSTPLSVGPTREDSTHIIVGETKYSFNGQNRDAWIIKDTIGNYVETVDKETGIVFMISIQEDEIITKWKKVTLLDTSMLERKAVISPEDLRIPGWLRTTTMWYLDGLITEGEYLASLDYLFENKMLIV